MMIIIFYLELGEYRQLSETVPSANTSVEIFTHHIGSIGAPRRRTVFVRGPGAEQREFPEIAGRKMKANIF
jgi:hypothetical protein